MFARRFLFCLALFLSCFQSTGATANCENIDNVLGTLSILRDVKANEDKKPFNDYISSLDNRLSLITLSALQPDSYRESFPEESQALFLYTSTLRGAVASAKAGYSESAQEILNASDPTSISESLLALNRYWNCSGEDATRGLAGLKAEESAFESNKTRPLEAEKEKSAAFSSGISPTGKKTGSPDLRQSLSNGPSLDIRGHPILSITMALILIALVYGGRKYSKRSRMRDYRHLIHQDTGFKLGKKRYHMTIIDITQRGLKFKHDGLIKRQRKVAIELNGDWYKCRLVWKNANFAGAKFRTPLKEETMNALLATVHQLGNPPSALKTPSASISA